MERLQGSASQRARQKEINDEKKAQEKKHTIRINAGQEEQGEKEDKEEDDESSISQVNAAFGLCAICHLTLGTTNIGLNQNVPCSKEHTLCHRCIQHFAIRSGTGCVLCRAQFQQSNTHLSRESTVSLNSMHAHSPKTREFSQQKAQNYNNQLSQQYAHFNLEESHVSPWGQNYTAAIHTEGNTSREVYDLETNSCYERIRDQHYTESTTIEYSKEQQQRRRSYCSLLKKEQPEPYISELKVNGQNTLECSRRPIHCPRIDCAINVAFSALTHHFIFDHPEVPILSVDPGTKSTLIVSFGALSSGSSRCLALLLVSGKLSDPVARLFNGNQINPKYRNRLPLPVLAARLRCTNRYINSDKVPNNGESCSEKDVIIAWVAGLDIGNTTERLRCSIQAVDSIDNKGLRSLTYTGPVNSLRTAQRPRDVFSAGDCIVLHEGLLSHITSDCTHLNVNVTVH